MILSLYLNKIANDLGVPNEYTLVLFIKLSAPTMIEAPSFFSLFQFGFRNNKRCYKI